MAGANWWIMPIGELAREAAAGSTGTSAMASTTGLAAVLQARATLEAANVQRETSEQLVKAATDTAAETKRLVRATLWVAGFTAFAALAATAAAIAALVNASAQ
jgi:hypothetical protein